VQETALSKKGAYLFVTVKIFAFFLQQVQLDSEDHPAFISIENGHAFSESEVVEQGEDSLYWTP
jgi:hypothetical protein